MDDPESDRAEIRFNMGPFNARLWMVLHASICDFGRGTDVGGPCRNEGCSNYWTAGRVFAQIGPAPVDTVAESGSDWSN